jgi:hypothetical protein
MVFQCFTKISIEKNPKKWFSSYVLPRFLLFLSPFHPMFGSFDQPGRLGQRPGGPATKSTQKMGAFSSWGGSEWLDSLDWFRGFFFYPATPMIFVVKKTMVSG